MNQNARDVKSGLGSWGTIGQYRNGTKGNNLSTKSACILMSQNDQTFLALATTTAQLSLDQSTKVGAVIVRDGSVVSIGYNCLPLGIGAEMIGADRCRDIKLAVTIHAEVNALMRAGEQARGATLYVWPLPPCASCAAMIVQCGIVRVVAQVDDERAAERWARSIALSERLFALAGVDYTAYTGGTC
jgi:dCMP deaminase